MQASSKTRAPLKKHPRGKRGLERDELVEASLGEIERAGLDGFTVRCAARAIGCDPSALIYHFKSKEGLERAVADRLHSDIVRPDAKLSWDQRLVGVARQYRGLARRYPNGFPLLLRYWTAGPKDLAVAQDCYRAFADAGLADTQIPIAECGFYAAILGLCAGEIGGVVGRPDRQTLEHIRKSPELSELRRLLPVITSIDSKDVFEAALAALIAGYRPSAQKPSKTSGKGAKP